MKILYVKDRYGVHDRRFLQAIMAQGHSPVAVQLGSDSMPSVDPGVFVRCLKGEDLLELARNESVDVVHIGPVPFASSVADQLPKGLPWVVVSWGSDILLDSAQTPELKTKALVALRRAKVVLVDCRAVAETISSWLPDFRGNVISFPWGLDLPRFAALPLEASRALRKSLGWDECDVFVSTRSWEENYGIQSLVEAFALLVRKAPKARLLLVGDGSLRQDIRNMIASRGLDAFIHTPGRIDELELPVMYGAADVYISSSYCDGSSISLLEAMANGRPVIAHREFGNLDWVKHEENGWLADCRGPLSLADTMMVALAGRNRWQTMGQRGKALVFEKADWASNSLLLSKAYQLALGGAEA